jgi:hypothetical protein
VFPLVVAALVSNAVKLSPDCVTGIVTSAGVMVSAKISVLHPFALLDNFRFSGKLFRFQTMYNCQMQLLTNTRVNGQRQNLVPHPLTNGQFPDSVQVVPFL